MRPSLLKPNQTVQYHGLCGRFPVKFVERAAADAGRPACNYFQADKFKTADDPKGIIKLRDDEVMRFIDPF